MRAARSLGAYLRRARFVQLWTGPTIVLLGVAALAIHTLSFRRIAGLLGHMTPVGAPAAALTEGQAARAIAIARTVRIAARHAPFRSDCYPQAIAASLLLRAGRIPHRILFGVDPGDARGLRAHCWVRAGEVGVTRAGGGTYRAVAAFGYPR